MIFRKNIYKAVTPLLLGLLVFMNSCGDVFDLNELPQDLVSADQVFENEAFAEALAADLYALFPFTSFSTPGGGHKFAGPLGHHDLGTQRGGSFSGCRTHGGMNLNTDCEGLWDYEYIRELNFFIENIRASALSEAFKRQMEGEVRVLRAATYFKMQKRYGGVPLVDVVLDPFEEVPEEYLARSTEEALADFIDSELEAAAGLLTENSEQTGRVNRWTAYAYKARANLWSASIAKFGTLADNQLTGIPSSRANEFYEKASAAARQVINSGNYSLLQGADPVQTFFSIGVEDSNAETIFERIYNGVEINHAFAHQNQPTPYSEGQGSQMNPTLELVNHFENLDGTFSTPELGPDNLYADGDGPWANKDPRLYATVLFEGDLYAGNVVNLYEGIDPTVGGTNPDAIISEVGVSYNGKPSVGNASRRQANQFFPSTGFLLKKLVAEIPFVPDDREAYNWKELRLGEMYLIVAESEFELGNMADAAMYLNFTRERVGLKPLNAGTITRDRVRIERTSELIYEGHRWDDLRRWRTAQETLNGQIVGGVRVIYHDDSGQYYFLPIQGETVQRLFRPEHYYNPITLARIETNGALVENPGY
ncbi:Starch-binding associating with outer membrane [Cyclobacterium lianum]|uniref:Starch-binding associating with outer membrane n=1 Tax=Cyclobacterium lianum TaxID=388280 RepID=A0A1M7QJQ4_9BACT|nr:RagB/SusD family nutrient uptake outer membrane protein [Cyclobacterium lianum]SHN31348.1 Starch-binding associating with outer membrane [Cyclobacterium lianum]